MAAKNPSPYSVPMVRMSKMILSKRNEYLMKIPGPQKNTKLHNQIIERIIKKYSDVDLSTLQNQNIDHMTSVVIPIEHRQRLFEIKEKLGLNFTQLYLGHLIDLLIENDLI